MVVRVNTLRCRGARERDGVVDVGEAGDVGEGALEAEAEPGVRHRAVGGAGHGTRRSAPGPCRARPYCSPASRAAPRAGCR
jgi:hypothetical protein